MNFFNLLKIAVRALNRNKLRAVLTMLGIIIGISAVICMLAIGQGSKDSIKAQISEMGSNMIMIHPGNMQRGGVRQSADDMQTLKIADYEALRDRTAYLSAVSPMVQSSGQMVVGNNNWPSSISGVTPEYMDIRKLAIDDGEMFTESDIKSAAKVCLLGKTVVDNLFPGGENPIGKVVRFGKVPFTVIGVLKQRDQFNGYGSGRCGDRPLYYSDEAPPCRRLSWLYFRIGAFGRNDRGRYQRNNWNTSFQPQAR